MFMKIAIFFLIFIQIFLIKSQQHKTIEEIEELVKEKVITYGSVLRVQNVMTKF